MAPPIRLSGLDHLASVCRAHGLRHDTWPPREEASRPQAALLDQPFDPVLREVFSRLNGGFLAELFLFPIDDSSREGLSPLNKRMRDTGERQLQEILLYGKFRGLAYYLATVPSLADSEGVQPVVHLDLHEGIEILPIGSSVDTAFDLYARYLEILAERYGSIQAGTEALALSFPYDIPEFVAQDGRLVHLLEHHQFEPLVTQGQGGPDWIRRVLQRVQR